MFKYNQCVMQCGLFLFLFVDFGRRRWRRWHSGLSSLSLSTAVIINNDEKTLRFIKFMVKKRRLSQSCCFLVLNLLAFITYIGHFAGSLVFFVNRSYFVWCYDGDGGGSSCSRHAITIGVCCIGYNYFVRIGYTTFGFFAVCNEIRTRS